MLDQLLTSVLKRYPVGSKYIAFSYFMNKQKYIDILCYKNK